MNAKRGHWGKTVRGTWAWKLNSKCSCQESHPLSNELYGLFVGDTAEATAANGLETLARQVGEMRAAEPDEYAMTDAEIATAVQQHARSLLNCIVCGKAVNYDDPGWFEHQLGDEAEWRTHKEA